MFCLQIVVDNDVDLESLGEGDKYQALFNKKMYLATIVGSGELWMHPTLFASLSLSLSLS